MVNKLPSETSEQQAVVTWLTRRGVRFFAVPNGANVSRKERSKLLKEGMTPGVADLIIPRDGGALCLEMKRRSTSSGRKRGALSAAQKAWRDGLPAGWEYLVAYGAEDAINQLKGLGYDGAEVGGCEELDGGAASDWWRGGGDGDPGP